MTELRWPKMAAKIKAYEDPIKTRKLIANEMRESI